MSIKENKTIIQRFYELFNQRKFDIGDELLAPGFIFHQTTGNISREEFDSETKMLLVAFPDSNLAAEHIVAEGNMVAYREIFRGTHKGEFMGIAPTGKKVEMINTCIMKIVHGKLVEGWATIDEFHLMQQLGVVPSMGQK